MKHKHHTILGYVFVFFAFMAVVSLIYYAQVENLSESLLEFPTHKITSKTYMSKDYGFHIKHPSNLPARIDALNDYGDRAKPKTFEDLAKPVVSFTIPNYLYQNTNLIEAYAFVGAAKNISNEVCRKFTLAVESSTKPETQIVGGLVFTESTYKGAAAGNIYQSRSYRIFQEGTCVEINLNLHTGNIDNYEKGTVKAVDEADVWSRLESILQSFAFADLESVFCGGLAGLPCPREGYECVAEGNFPDAGTICRKN